MAIRLLFAAPLALNCLRQEGCSGRVASAGGPTASEVELPRQ